MPRQRKVDKLPLLDVPDLWLCQLATGYYLDRDSMLNLFQACRQLNGLILEHAEVISIYIKLLDRPMDTALKALEIASRHSSSIRLVLNQHLEKPQGQWYYSPAQENKLNQMGREVCSFPQAANKRGATKGVILLKLVGACVNSILPAAIGQACPNLNTYVLRKCCIKLSSTVGGNKHYQKLEGIQLSDVQFSRSTVEQAAKHKQQLQAQLKGLPALQQFYLIRANADMPNPVAFQRELVASLTSKVTNLCWERHGFTNYLDFTPMPWLRPGTVVQHLQLPSLVVTGHSMEILMQMHSLRQLEVNCFLLMESYAGHPCRWEQVTCKSIGFITLARLPLHSDMLLKVDSLDDVELGMHDDSKGAVFSMDSAASEEMMQQAITNVQKCEALEWGDESVRVTCERLGAGVFAEQLARALPLFGTAQILSIEAGCKLHDMHLTSLAIETLISFVRNNKQDHIYLTLEQHCTWEAEHLVRLMQAMPCDSILELHLRDVDLHAQHKRPCEQLITQLCCAAQCKCTLHAICRAPLQRGYMKRVMSAMRACGHEHVELDVTIWYGMFCRG